MKKIRVFFLRVFFIAIWGLIPAGCAFMGAGPTIPSSFLDASKVEIAAVPFFAQKKYHCGPAALAMALQWSGVETVPDQLVSAVYTPGRKGSFQSEMITAARRRGRLAYPIQGMECLLREVGAKRPVIVLQNLGIKWLPRWHYAVVVGYDLEQQQVVLHTGESASRRVGFRTFLHTWNRSENWGLLVLPVEDMPLCAKELPYLKAALGLQLAGHTQTALRAFEQAVKRWPQSAPAHIALGNAQYLTGRMLASIESFKLAVQIEPGNAGALNNLAHLLAETGDFETAEQMARRAVKVGGPHRKVYQQTLDEIRRRATQ